MKSFSQKPTRVNRQWYVLDAGQLTLGRLSTRAASLLIGKSKPTITPHTDAGDYVIVINAQKVRVTGNKLKGKVYYSHSQYPGGIKSTNLEDMMANDPTRVIYQAVRGMIPVNKLRAARLQRLRVYADDKHEHEAQKPNIINFKEDN